MKKVDIYTDGSCSGNPGPGGWGAILMYQGLEKELSGGEKQTTNNRMELTGAIQALEALREPCQVTLYTDSQYLTNAINQHWLTNWKKRDWKKADKSPVLNQELWQALDRQLSRHQVTFVWVKGLADTPSSYRCEHLAGAQSRAHR